MTRIQTIEAEAVTRIAKELLEADAARYCYSG